MTKPRVKPLVWDEWYGRSASDPWGGYYICDRSGPNDEWDWFGWSHSSRGDTDESQDDFPTVEAAKAAAQADYEARILSALDRTPDPAVLALVDIASIASAHLHQLARDRDLSEGELDFMRRVDAALAAFDKT